ncbi:hypothetical protein Vadar_034126 [Vaccinium darrowii]|uniref:Uncharacterized protein n=1 Tax=Vaccinium darrowii TaxID=229202 RepID=A0ACB7ZHD9_9ERIC|nr:hypothetical protein Vadar_034126 [Vaccinium darrowii]
MEHDLPESSATNRSNNIDQSYRNAKSSKRTGPNILHTIVSFRTKSCNVAQVIIEMNNPSKILQKTFSNVTRHNCARDFHEYHGISRSLLPAPRTCRHCHARLFLHETTELCCKSGKTVLPPIPAPPEMIDLFCEQIADGRHFRKNIKAYKHVFSSTSMGVDFDEELAGGSRGVYTFRAHGAIDHKIGSLLPYSRQRPRYLQRHLYDTEHEVENRMSETSGLRRHIVKKLKHILDAHNPFVQNFRQMAQSADIQNYKLIIKEQLVDRRQYDLPTTSQVAAIIVGGDEATFIRGRDIAIQPIGGNLRYIQDIVGFYDPMQHPFLYCMGPMDGM